MKTKMTQNQKRRLSDIYHSGLTRREMAAELKLSPDAVSRRVERLINEGYMLRREENSQKGCGESGWPRRTMSEKQIAAWLETKPFAAHNLKFKKKEGSINV